MKELACNREGKVPLSTYIRGNERSLFVCMVPVWLIGPTPVQWLILKGFNNWPRRDLFKEQQTKAQ